MPFALPDITEREVEAVSECLRSGWVTTGRKTKEFEEKFASFIGVKHALAVNSATAGALLILDALGIGPGDEVIVPAYTFSGPAMMAHHLGAKIVLVDSYLDDPAMHGWDCTQAITERTKAIMPTHFAGIPYEGTGKLKGVTHIQGVPIIHDAAHAFPTRYADGTMVGSKGLATFFSFYATKCITTGEGGMITTNDDDLADRIRKLRLHGFDRSLFDRYTNAKAGWRYDISAEGWKANMTDLSAALGLVQLDRAYLMRWTRQQIADDYDKAFTRAGIELLKHPDGSSYHLYQIYMPSNDRDEFISRMADKGIQCSVHFIPLHMHTAWQKIGVNDCPQAESLYKQVVSLPIHSKMNQADVDRVIAAVVETAGELVECSLV
jgi:dTDP-4-amino-4,6-dideoxygalactose transaminase